MKTNKQTNLPSFVTISELYNKVYWDKEMPETKKKMLKVKVLCYFSVYFLGRVGMCHGGRFLSTICLF